MEREEIALLAICYLAQVLSETGRGEATWAEVGEAATLVHFPRENQDRLFERWEAQGWLDGKYKAPRRCGLSSGGHHVARSHLNFRPR